MEQRPTAIPVWITDILSGSPIQHDELPTAFLLPDKTTIQRARVYGIAVSTTELVVDDGTGSILVRSFDPAPTISIGDAILVIGRPRVYNNQPYLLGEIVKKIDPLWLTIRKKPQTESPKETAISAIRKLDTGMGADYQEVINKLGPQGENIIIHLLANGDLFETRPGKLKILE